MNPRGKIMDNTKEKPGEKKPQAGEPVNIGESLKDVYAALDSIDVKSRTAETEKAKETVAKLQKDVDEIESHMFNKRLQNDDEKVLENVIIKRHLEHEFERKYPKKVKEQFKFGWKQIIIIVAAIGAAAAIVVLSIMLMA